LILTNEFYEELHSLYHFGTYFGLYIMSDTSIYLYPNKMEAAKRCCGI